MPRLSIVIPVLGDPQQLDDTLLSVLENRPANCELLVVHNQPYHDPYNLSDEVRFVEAERGAGMVACVGRGLAASQSPVVHVLACGVEVCPGWADVALRHFGDPNVVAVGAVVLDRDDGLKVISAGWGYRAEGTAWRLGWQCDPDEVAAQHSLAAASTRRVLIEQDYCGPDTLAAFYRKSAIERVGGFSVWVGDALAGVDLALALRQAGFRCALEPQCIARASTAAIHPEPAFRYGHHAERLFWHWASSQGWLSSIAGHIALLAGQCVISLWRPSMLVQLAGRVCGMLQAAFAPRRVQSAEAVSDTTPSVVAAPHFAAAPLRKEQRSSRVA